VSRDFSNLNFRYSFTFHDLSSKATWTGFLRMQEKASSKSADAAAEAKTKATEKGN
jgi:hypothetical protein